MHIMAARVHHGHFKTVDPDLFHRGRVGKTGAFLHRQTVHVRADKDNWTITVFQHTDNASATDGMATQSSGL